MKQIERPDWLEEVIPRRVVINLNNSNNPHLLQDMIDLMNRSWDGRVKPVNRMLREAVEVYANQDEFTTTAWAQAKGTHPQRDTHKAYLIDIQPIKEKTREEKLEEAIELLKIAYNMDHAESYGQAMRLLNDKNK